MTFNWLDQVKRQFNKPRPSRKRRKNRRRNAPVAGEVCEQRTLLSGTGMTVDMTSMQSTTQTADADPNMPIMMHADPTAHANMNSDHNGHAHPAAMALISADQATNTVVASGNWSDPAVWQNGTLPTDGARIIIPQNMTVTVDSAIPQEFKTIGIHGTLNFATDVNTELRVDTIVSAPHGRFEMGTAANPIAANVTARVVFSDDGVIDRTWDPEQLSRGAILQGRTEIHGAATTHNVSLAVQPTAGTSTLQLTAAPSGWNVGDEVIITGTNGPTSDEVRTISAIDGSNVTLNTPLSQDHIAPKDSLDVYVANTTRNVEFTSENTATAHRGHIMFMHTNNVNVANAKFTELGRTDKKIPLDDLNFDFTEDAVGNTTSAGVVFTTTPGARNNIRGRYPVHFHRGGTTPGSTPAVVDGSVIVSSPGYGYVNHSSNVHLTNNVSYDVHGSAYYTEAGDEIGTIENNIAIRTVNPDFRLEENGEISVDLRADVQDFGVDGDAFWLSGHLVSMKNNIASGASGHGIIIWSDGLVEADLGRSTVKTADIANGHLIQGRDTIPTWWAPLAEISNNEASNATIGFRARYIHSSIYLGEVGSPFHEPPSQEYIDTLRPEINGLKVWGSRDGALLNYNERLSLKNAEIVGVGAPYVRQGGTTDLGVGIDMYNDVSRGPGVVENVSVEGFNMGILAPRHNGWQMNNIHLRNTTDLHIEQATGTHRVLELSNITFGDLAGTAVAGNEGQRQNIVMQGSGSDVEQPFWFLMTDTVTLDGQGLYFNEQAANHVPLTEANLGEARVPAPAEFVGLTNQQLQDRYGTSFAGEITPNDAQTASWLSGGVVGSLPSLGQTTPPLYDLRDGGEANIPILGNLANFDTSQLPTGGTDDEDEGDDTDTGDDDDGDDTDTGDDEDEGDDTDTADDEEDEGDDTDTGDDEDEGDDTDTGDDDEGEGDDTDTGDDDEGEGDDTDTGDDDEGEGDDTDTGDDDEGEGDDTDTGDDDEDEGDDTDTGDDDEGEGDDTDTGDDDEDEGDDTDTGDDDEDEGDDTDTGDDDEDEGDDTDTGDDDEDEGDDTDTGGDGDVNVTRGVQYGQGSLNGINIPLTLDIHQPSVSAAGPRPLIVMIHGGGFVEGDRGSMSDLAQQMAGKGYVVANIGYRLNAAAGDVGQPFLQMSEDALANVESPELPPASAAAAAFEDAATALNWLSSNASTYGIDASRIAVWGESAGAVTALQSAYALDDYGVSVPKISAVVSHAGALGVDSLMETGEAPLFIIHGTNDEIVPFVEAQQLKSQAENVGVFAELKAVSGAGHDVTLDQEVDGSTLADSVAGFLATSLSHDPVSPDTGDDDEGDGDDTDTGDDDEGEGDDTDTGDDDEGEGDDTDTGDDDEGEGDDTDTGDDDEGDETDTGDDDEGEGDDTDAGDDDEGEGDDTDAGDDDEGEGDDTDTGDDEGEGDETDTGDDDDDDDEGDDTGNNDEDEGDETDTGDDDEAEGDGTDTGDDDEDEGGETDTGDDDEGEGDETDTAGDEDDTDDLGTDNEGDSDEADETEEDETDDNRDDERQSRRQRRRLRRIRRRR